MATLFDFVNRCFSETAQNLSNSYNKAIQDKKSSSSVRAAAEMVYNVYSNKEEEVNALALEIVKEAGARIVGFTAVGFIVGIITGAPLTFTVFGCMSGIVYANQVMNEVALAKVNIHDQKNQKIFFRFVESA